MKANSAATGHFLELKIQVMGGDYDKRTVFDRLNLDNPNQQTVDIAYRTLSAICHAVGKGQQECEDSQMLHGIPLLFKVSERPARTDPTTGTRYEASNDVKGYKAIDPTAAPVLGPSKAQQRPIGAPPFGAPGMGSPMGGAGVQGGPPQGWNPGAQAANGWANGAPGGQGFPPRQAQQPVNNPQFAQANGPQFANGGQQYVPPNQQQPNQGYAPQQFQPQPGQVAQGQPQAAYQPTAQQQPQTQPQAQHPAQPVGQPAQQPQGQPQQQPAQPQNQPTTNVGNPALAQGTPPPWAQQQPAGNGQAPAGAQPPWVKQ